ncbi:aldehyde dehydrogenase family protein [Novosphingobium sp.]|uniref:aldehyde dehydrogenase family protein n=1 Tax=Novosphingobium sp. TaxID=1874826 RepID=UPI0025DD749D|nr:aldehyde dehydrogenase family protein [Novosphingobium sp.]
MPIEAPIDLAGWQALAATLRFETGLLIDGHATLAQSGESFAVINPANGKLLAEPARGGAADIDRAVASARAAWDDGRWRHMAPRLRMDIFRRWADLVEGHRAELALLETLSMGKPITDALTIDLPEVVVTIRYFGECIDKVAGAATSSPHNAVHMVSREPLGVVGAISAWNYPLLMATWKIAPALAAGNCVVLKPAEQAPLSCLRLAQLFLEAGGPPGVFNVVNGPGADAGRARALHPDVAKISFTGSTATGKQLMIYAGESNLKRVALETGGKSPQIFMPDLADLDSAVDRAIMGIFDNAGQVCNAGSRLLVHRDLRDAFIERFVARTAELYRPGDPLDPATSLGPMVTRAHQRQVLDRVAQGRADGATVALGGSDDAARPDGAYVVPTLLTDLTPTMAVGREEIFGPVASLFTFTDEVEAITLANDSIYGLAASVWTSDLNRAHRMVKALEAGVVWVNCFGDGDMTQPFGGYKQSGNTRDKSMECLAGYMQSKSAWFSLD